MSLEKILSIHASADWSLARVQDSETKKIFLLKEVNPASPYHDQLKAGLAAEVQSITESANPGVVQVVSFDPDSGSALFSDVQCSLHQYLVRRGPMKETLVGNVINQAAKALAHLHAQHKGHGCVSTHTLFLDPEGCVKFANFLAFGFGATAALRIPDPEPAYLAPEFIINSLGKCGPTSDLYALGFTAVELLAASKFRELFNLPEGANWLTWHGDPQRKLEHWRAALHQASAGLLDIIEGLIAKARQIASSPSAEQLCRAAREVGAVVGAASARVRSRSRAPGTFWLGSIHQASEQIRPRRLGPPAFAGAQVPPG